MENLINVGKVEVSVIIDDGGHFEKGRWVTIFTPLIDYIFENLAAKEETFDVTGHIDVPLFRQGACIGYECKEISLGIYTKSEIELIMRDSL